MVNFVDGERYCACAPGNTETLPVPAAAVSVDEEVAVVPAAPPRTGRRVRRRFRLVDHTLIEGRIRRHERRPGRPASRLSAMTHERSRWAHGRCWVHWQAGSVGSARPKIWPKRSLTKVSFTPLLRARLVTKKFWAKIFSKFYNTN